MLSLSSVLSLLLLPLLARGAPATLSHSGSLHPGHLDSGQALLATMPPNTTSPPGHNSTGGPPNTTLSASSGSIVLFPASGPLSPSPSPQVSSTTNGVKPLVMAYYPDWAGPSFGPEKINYALYDWIDFAFAIPDASFRVTWDSPGSTLTLQRLVQSAHEKGAKVKLSIGGWTGSKFVFCFNSLSNPMLTAFRHFSQAVASEENRRIFAKNINDTYDEFNLDGIDIDWEYPGHGGAGGNKVDPNDSINFLLFLQLLRGILPPVARLTAAAQTVPFVDASGQPMKDVSKFAEVLDWVLIMNYDVWTGKHQAFRIRR
jgi:chitinase